MALDREVLRVRLIDILSTFAPRATWDYAPRVNYWLDRLMEADLPDDGSEKFAAVVEVERLRRRVAELEVAYDLQREIAMEVEGERMTLHRQIERVRALVEDSERELAQYGPPSVRDYEDLVDMVPTDVLREVIGDTPSTPVVDSE